MDRTDGKMRMTLPLVDFALQEREILIEKTGTNEIHNNIFDCPQGLMCEELEGLQKRTWVQQIWNEAHSISLSFMQQRRGALWHKNGTGSHLGVGCDTNLPYKYYRKHEIWHRHTGILGDSEVFPTGDLFSTSGPSCRGNSPAGLILSRPPIQSAQMDFL